jgi:alpha-tubulin suppressor-like RCC1 family protein
MLRSRLAGVQRNRSGFALPTVLIASIVMLIVLLSSVSAASTIRVALDEQFYLKLAQEAAEAGQARADACLEANNYIATWTDASRLRPDTTCTGATIGGGNKYISSYGNIRTTFVVWAPVAASPGLATVTVVGTTELFRTSGGTVNQSYTHTLVRQSGNEATYSTDSSSGVEETCGIVNQKTYCWGSGVYGRLGNGSTATSLTPVEVSRQAGILAGRVDTNIAVGVEMACNIASGRAFCWGANTSGKLGNNSTLNSTVPVAVVTTTGMSDQLKQIAAGHDHVCALTVGGDVYCWGANALGQLGIGSITAQSLTPVRVAGIGTYVGRPVTNLATAIFSDSTCAIATTGSGPRAFCWGYNQAGQLGDGTTTTRTTATPVDTSGVLSGKTVTDISIAAAGSDGTLGHTCAVASGLAYCWGTGTDGALGNNSTANSLVPVAVYTAGVLSAKTVLEVNLGVWHACVTARDASSNVAAYCWGQNASGQLGNNTTTNSSVPVAVSVLSGGLQGHVISALKGGGNRGCVIADNTTYCWGLNYIGQLGDGTTTTRTVPTVASFLVQKVPVINY